jgi:predicted HTH transcriptional regulator
MPDELRPLCINLLGNGLEGKRSLESSVGGMLRKNEEWSETRFQWMLEVCTINGNPKPELKEMKGAFVVKFTRRPASEGINGGVNEGINQLFEFIRKSPDKRVVEIAAALNIPSKTIERWIKKLREQGKIVFSGPRKSGGYFVSK